MNHVSQQELEYLDDEHLTDALIQEYLSENPEHLGVSGQRIEAHLKKCEDCGQRALSAFRDLEGLRANDRVSPEPYPYCPAPEILDEIAAGLASSEITAHNLRHAADCDHCGPLLKKYLEIYSEEMTPEDAKLLAEVQGSAASWRKQMIRKIVKEKPEPAWRTWILQPRTALMTALAAIVAVAGIRTAPMMIARYELWQANQLYAQAVREARKRYTPMRRTSEPYTEYASKLSEGSSAKDNNNLLRAKLIVNPRAESPSDKFYPQWLQLKARLTRLEYGRTNLENLEAVRQKLEEAKAAGLNTPSLEIDLAAAYYERDSAHNPKGPSVLDRTIDLLEGVRNDPRIAPQEKAVALFDLAYAYEKSELRDSAAKIWQEYRKLDSTSDWANEAGSRLKEVTKNVPELEPENFGEPSSFLRLSSEQRESHLERYINIALRKWLYPAIEDPSSDAKRALRELADLLAGEKHHDPMLKDLIRLTKEDLPAVESLSAAMEDNHNDDNEGATQKASKAVHWFAARKNLAGELLARYARAYGLRRGLKGECLLEVNEIQRRLRDTKYPWLKGQTLLEQAQCANRNLELAEQSRQLAEKCNFPVLEMRAIGFQAGMRRSKHDTVGAWTDSVTGLKKYWQNPGDTERLYQFYAVLWQTAADENLPNAEIALLRQGIDIRRKYFQNDIPMLAMLHFKLANRIRDYAGAQSQEAESHDNEALALVREAPDKATAKKYLLYEQITFGDKKLQQSEGLPEKTRQLQASLALKAIEPVKDLLESQDKILSLDFYRVRANARRQLKDLKGAVEDYQFAINLSENSLGAIRDEKSRANWILKSDEIDRGLTLTLLQSGASTNNRLSSGKRVPTPWDKKALYVWERLRSRSLEAGDTAGPSLEDLQLENEIFDPQPPLVSQTHIIYAVFREGVEIWTVKDAVVTGHWVPIEQEHLQKLVREFADQCADEKGSLDNGLELSSILLQPVRDSLPDSGLLIVELDQALSRLPIEALPLLGRERDFLGTKYPVVRSPGIFAEELLRRRQPFQARAPFLLVDPSSEPGHEKQVEAIRHVFPLTRVIDSADIKGAQIAQALPASYGFHFTGHGSGNALYINPGLTITGSDFTRESLAKVQLAVLAACSTGSTRNGILDPDNLVRSFLRAGVPSVIASQWDVDAERTADMMKSFYSHLSISKGDPAVALQQARREMAMGSAKNSPYYWASFTLTGRAD